MDFNADGTPENVEDAARLERNRLSVIEQLKTVTFIPLPDDDPRSIAMLEEFQRLEREGYRYPPTRIR